MLDAIKQLSTDVGIPAGLIELGKRYGKNVKKEYIAIMTANAQKDACGLTNPRKLKDADVAAIYEAAL
jgi:alcohol dehydrogenase